jgi:predicted secreted hydrolase
MTSFARRHLLGAATLAWAGSTPALPARELVFPRDHGAHPDLRTEWWYLTGALSAGAREFGFQITFFRTRVPGTAALQSRLAARQLVFAHLAVTDVQGRRLWHDQRMAREGFGVARLDTKDTDAALDGWSLTRTASGYRTAAQAAGFGFELELSSTQPLLLQGDQGLSRKGPLPRQASYYYSQPQLRVGGVLTLEGKRLDVKGLAWLDHEWSESLLDPQAVGWDWIGMNLDDGSALTAFRLRRRDGSTLFSGGSFRAATSRGLQTFIASPGEVEFSAQRRWTSPRTRANYPVEWIVRTPADFYTVRALVDDQELDSQASTGTVYWEGLSDLFDSNGRRVGRGYLEMTGYARPLVL